MRILLMLALGAVVLGLTACPEDNAIDPSKGQPLAAPDPEGANPSGS